MKLTFNLNVAETGETMGDRSYGMGNMNGNGWNQKRNSASYGANGALVHDLNNG